MRNVTILLAVAVVLALVAPANAAVTYGWTNGTGDNNWATDGNWDVAGKPGDGDSDRAEVKMTGANLCEITGNETSERLKAGWFSSSGEVELKSGSYTCTSFMWVGVGCTPGDNLGKFTQSGGTMTGSPYIGTYSAGNGIYTITGGTIASGNFEVGLSTLSDTKGVGVFRVEGTGATNAISISMTSYTQGAAGGTLEIVLDTTDAGVAPIVVTGNATLTGELDVTASGALAKSEYKIMTFASHDGAGFTLDEHLIGTWNLEYRDSGKELWLVPEPATLSLLALGGIGAMIRRRRK